MKIRVNYDLMDKIKESKTGFVLKRTLNRCLIATSISFLVQGLMDVTALIPDNALKYFCLFFSLNVALHFPYDYAVASKVYKKLALNELKNLASILRSHYINTDYELLQQSYEYETNYSFILDDDKIPRLKQEKYIMVPVVDRDGKKEVSLVQEHLIGSKDYELSYGSPKKVLKPVFNGI